MKIGIITIHKSPNYGACLQAYALYTYLAESGYDCEIIDLLRPTHSDYIPSKRYIPYREKKLSLLGKMKNIVRRVFKEEKRGKNLTPKANEGFEVFNRQLKYSRVFCQIDELYQSPPQYDVYISGSDQLWNPTMGFCIEPYFLTFVNNGGRKISYATSIGIEHLTNKEKSDFRRWLSDYDTISVREKNAKEILETILNKEVFQVCDPSFLLDTSYWKNLMNLPSIEVPYILLFTLDYNPKLLAFCLRLKSESGLNLVYLCSYHPASKSSEYIVETDASPRDFLGYIAKSQMVITDSFHGTVFSIILEAENFFSYIPSSNKRGKRITDLLDTYHLMNHVLPEGLTTSYHNLVQTEYDKRNISRIKEREQERSRKFLLEHLPPL